MPENPNEYNGWTNYPTWNVALWLGNDEALYNVARDMARKASTIEELAGLLHELIAENTPTTTGPYADILGWSLQLVNWYEIARHWFDDERS